MEAIKSKTESTFKNKVIYFLIVMIVLESVVFLFKYKQLIDQYMEHAYFVSESNSYIGRLEKGYRIGPVEIRTHLRAFYSTMFSFNADNFESNTKFAKENLVDFETGKYIESVLVESDMHNKLYRMGGQLLTVLDSIGKVDFSKEPYTVKAYCRQFVVKGEEKSETRFINTMDIQAAGITRTDNNPQGLKITNWRNVKVD